MRAAGAIARARRAHRLLDRAFAALADDLRRGPGVVWYAIGIATGLELGLLVLR